MQILEVRNDVIKLLYSPQQDVLLLSDFILISESDYSVLAQVAHIESAMTSNDNIALLKCLLSVDNNGRLVPYIGYVPSKVAQISAISQEQAISIISAEKDLISWGYLSQNDKAMLTTGKSFLNNKPLVLMEDFNNFTIIVNNFVKELLNYEDKVVVFDFEGTLNLENAFKITLTENFKLPLSYDTFSYIFENDLMNEDIATKAVIQDIIIELQDYVKTLGSGFLPFSTVKNVVISQYEENKIPELMVLKNKFSKYAQDNFLAESIRDFNSINDALEKNNLVIIDLSKIESKWHKLCLNYFIKTIARKCYLITKLDNENSDKQTIFNCYTNQMINPIIISPYKHQFIDVLKSIAKNLVLFKPLEFLNDFATYTAFTEMLTRDEFILYGENTSYLSFIVKLTYLSTNSLPDYIEQEIKTEVDKFYMQPKAVESQPIENIEQQSNEENAENTENMELQETEETINQDEIVNEENLQPVEISVNDLTEEDLDFLDDIDDFDNDDELEASITDNSNNFSTSETDEDLDIIEEQENILKIEESTNIENQQEASTNMKLKQTEEPAIKNDAEEIITLDLPQEKSIVENEPSKVQNEPQKFENNLPVENHSIPKPKVEPKILNKTTPTIPIYAAPDVKPKDEIKFVEGNIIYHEKYGKGVIEKIMGYGNKTLCSIQFDNFGRRLLDPNLAGLKQA